ncbi:hypothetical protein N665_0034s0082 [Sinapis alba]|nr:hypothetical protein N665_0034s0082 [Sinapis alba]
MNFLLTNKSNSNKKNHNVSTKPNIADDGSPQKLLRMIKNPVTNYLPSNSRKKGFSYSSEKLVNMPKHLAAVCNETDIVFVLGAMSQGKIDCHHIEDFVARIVFFLLHSYCFY